MRSETVLESIAKVLAQIYSDRYGMKVTVEIK